MTVPSINDRNLSYDYQTYREIAKKDWRKQGTGSEHNDDRLDVVAGALQLIADQLVRVTDQLIHIKQQGMAFATLVEPLDKTTKAVTKYFEYLQRKDNDREVAWDRIVDCAALHLYSALRGQFKGFKIARPDRDAVRYCCRAMVNYLISSWAPFLNKTLTMQQAMNAGNEFDLFNLDHLPWQSVLENNVRPGQMRRMLDILQRLSRKRRPRNR